MRLNDDLTARTLVHAGEMPWIPSPARGVDRRMLFRIGGETARATSIVRYAPGSRFPRHEHPGGEEILVLEGVFQDESGDYPAGSYFRNPPGTGHAPGSDDGCVIFVKLWQFRDGDQVRIVRAPEAGDLRPPHPGAGSSIVLYSGNGEEVVIEEWRENDTVEFANPEGLELLVLEGSAASEGQQLDRWTWLRAPGGAPFKAKAGPAGVRVWYKLAPLMHANIIPMIEQG